MKALLVIDVQNAIVNFANFADELGLIRQVIEKFKDNNHPVIFIKHIEEPIGSPFYKEGKGAELHVSFNDYVDYVVEKQTPSSFCNTGLVSLLDNLAVDHVFITGFNTEFCCMFTAIAAYDRGYKVTFIEDATGTVNTGESYEMPNLDIRDFVGTVLDWSGSMEVLDFTEFVEKYHP